MKTQEIEEFNRKHPIGTKVWIVTASEVLESAEVYQNGDVRVRAYGGHWYGLPTILDTDPRETIAELEALNSASLTTIANLHEKIDRLEQELASSYTRDQMLDMFRQGALLGEDPDQVDMNIIEQHAHRVLDELKPATCPRCGKEVDMPFHTCAAKGAK